jgi:hypothetical protein
VVVHVVYYTTTQNISNTQIQSQITVLNNDFRRLNADRTNTPSTFSSLAADIEVEFCLASFDPNGNATTGITRTQTSKTIFDTQLNDCKYNSQGGKDAWNTSKYLNMWIVPSLKSGTTTGILGYAQFPGTGIAATDGVVICHNYFGTSGTVTAPFNKGRTTTHEVGHWLNLRHIWGDQLCGDDLVSDTPTHRDKNFNCPSHPKSNTCGTSAEMFMNYMDYVDDACMNMFSNGQKLRMRALFNAGGARVGLLTSTGCTGGTTTPTYCSARGNNVSYEFINNVTLNTINNTTTANAGYGDFTSLSTSLTKGTAYNISLKPGFVGTAYTEYFRVYIDFNNDKDFDDAGELVYTSAGTTTTVTGSFTIPTGATTGATRMRVMMKDGAISGPCETFTYGEVEDYTVNIANATPTCGNTSSLSATSITTNSATLNWAAVTGFSSYNVRYKPTSSSTWTTTTSTTNSRAISGLTASTAYEFQIQTVCSGASGTYTASANFATLTPCGNTSSLSATSITTNSATLNWSSVSGVTSYNVRYKPTISSTWTTTTSTTNSRAISGLTASTSYEFQVQTVCSGASGTYTASANFTTLSSTTCGTPVTNAASSITSTGATLSWAAVTGASTYSLRYRVNGTTTWTTVSNSTTSRVVFLLSASTTYEFQVASVCSGTTGAFSSSRTFTTLTSSNCGTDIYEANNTQAASKAITPGTSIRALICASGDIDFFSFTNTSAAPHIRVQLSTLPADYDLFLYNSAGTLINKSENGSTTSESITYNNAPVGTYYVRVIGYNGANNTTAYYTLLASRSSTAYTSARESFVPKDIEKSAQESDNSFTFNSLYPNPATDKLNLSFFASNESVIVYQIIDVLGKVVMNGVIENYSGNNLIELNISELNSGLYYIKSENGEFNKKFTVSK